MHSSVRGHAFSSGLTLAGLAFALLVALIAFTIGAGNGAPARLQAVAAPTPWVHDVQLGVYNLVTPISVTQETRFGSHVVAEVKVVALGAPAFDGASGAVPTKHPLFETRALSTTAALAIYRPVVLEVVRAYKPTAIAETGFVVLQRGGEYGGYQHFENNHGFELGQSGIVFLSPIEPLPGRPPWRLALDAVAADLTRGSDVFEVMGVLNWYYYSGADAISQWEGGRVISQAQLLSQIQDGL